MKYIKGLQVNLWWFLLISVDIEIHGCRDAEYRLPACRTGGNFGIVSGGDKGNYPLERGISICSEYYFSGLKRVLEGISEEVGLKRLNSIVYSVVCD